MTKIELLGHNYQLVTECNKETERADKAEKLLCEILKTIQQTDGFVPAPLRYEIKLVALNCEHWT